VILARGVADQDVEERATMEVYGSIPDRYKELTPEEIKRRIREHKEWLGEKLCVLGHYYQRDEVIEFADFQGDSFNLAQHGAATLATHIVFCGVRFMAEASSILARQDQRVYLPALDAGCPLSDMADISQVETAWRMLREYGIADKFLPVVYMNSSAGVKAFCGKLGGTVCTSSSAGRAFDWAASQKKKVFFMPDRNLGINTALAKGFGREEIGVWDPFKPDRSAAREAGVLVWDGHCHVHTFFTREEVGLARKQYPGCMVAVHPECDPEVVAISDVNGSTAFLKKFADEAAAGSTVVIGTEISFVSRIARENPGKKIVPLARSLCPNMFRTSATDLLWVLDELGRVNEIRVADETATQARLALDRMLAL